MKSNEHISPPQKAGKSFIGRIFYACAGGIKWVMLLLIRFYKLAISPYLPNACRFTPTCSEYAAQAIMKYGVIKGTALAARRLARCNPFCKGGYDPVP